MSLVVEIQAPLVTVTAIFFDFAIPSSHKPLCQSSHEIPGLKLCSHSCVIAIFMCSQFLFLSCSPADGHGRQRHIRPDGPPHRRWRWRRRARRLLGRRDADDGAHLQWKVRHQEIKLIQRVIKELAACFDIISIHALPDFSHCWDKLDNV